jgi:hypothetical protein
MVRGRKKDRAKEPARQGFQETASEPNKIGASTPYQFNGKNLTAYGGLLPVATMLERLGFQALVEETLMGKHRRQFSAALKAKIAVEAIKGQRTVQEIGSSIPIKSQNGKSSCWTFRRKRLREVG